MRENVEKVENVSGSRDFRMIPVAAACWAGCLIGKFLCDFTIIYCISIVLFNATIVSIFIFCKKFKFFIWRRTVLVIINAFVAAFMLSYITQYVISGDVIMREIRGNNPTKALCSRGNNAGRAHFAEFTVVTPVRSSRSFKGDCQANVQVHKFDAQKSYVQARLYAYLPICKQLSYGSSLSVPVSVKASRFDSSKPELHVEKTQRNLHVAQDSDFWHKAVSNLWKSFYDVTNKLDMQGRMLVPGVTVGMLGQEYVPVEDASSLEPVDETYANMTRQHFQHAGIMHVMAVSGGHFLLLSMIIRKFCARLLLARWATSLIQITLQIALAAIVYPSASVLRALIMGIISAVAWCCKRPYQSVSALSWTVIGVLLVNPSYAWDYAFALSSAATLGIVVMGVPISKTLAKYMPSCVASALAITLSAQFWTMPVQILMQPEVSFMSVPANLIVAPLMDWATVCGLISLVCASFNGGLSLIFARASSIGTSFMQKCACWCDEVSFGVFPWIKGAAGAWAMLCAEFVILALFMLALRAFRNKYYAQRASIIGQLWSASAKRTLREAEKIFEE